MAFSGYKKPEKESRERGETKKGATGRGHRTGGRQKQNQERGKKEQNPEEKLWKKHEKARGGRQNWGWLEWERERRKKPERKETQSNHRNF